MTMRKILFIITFFLCINAFSQEKVEYTYSQKDSTLIIRGRGVINNYDVNKYSDKCVKVVISEGIEGVQFFSFYNFKYMKEILFPNSLRFVGKNSFVCCVSLDSVVIPPKVRYLVGSFTNCDNLKHVTFPDSIGVDLRTFDNCKNLKRLSFVHLLSYANCYLKGCENLEIIEVKDSTSRYKTLDGLLYADDRVIIYPYAKKDKSYRFPNFVRRIERLSNPHVEEIYVSDDIKDIHIQSCDNLKKIISENKIFYENGVDGLKIDSLVVHIDNKNNSSPLSR